MWENVLGNMIQKQLLGLIAEAATSHPSSSHFRVPVLLRPASWPLISPFSQVCFTFYLNSRWSFNENKTNKNKKRTTANQNKPKTNKPKKLSLKTKGLIIYFILKHNFDLSPGLKCRASAAEEVWGEIRMFPWTESRKSG